MKTKGIYLLYRVLQAFGLPLLICYLAYRGLRNRRYLASIRQRFGFLPPAFKQTTPGSIWLHAVSVGEVVASVELIRLLRMELPQTPVFVSTSTVAGQTLAQDKLRDLCAGVFYAPLDYVFAVRRVLRTLQPSVVVILETELWPNLFREVRRTGAGLMLVNGRISDRAAPRYLSLRWFFTHVLASADTILTQNETMRRRFLGTGASPEAVRVGGNLKYDVELGPPDPDSPVLQFLDRVQPRQVWIAASTMPPRDPGDVDEDDVVIQAFLDLERYPGLLLIIAPRRPERFDVVAHKLQQSVRYVRRSQLDCATDLVLPGVLLLDSIGELSSLFSIADVVFVGGSLASRGGHNILEPAVFGRPIVIGPHMENFADIAEEFRAARACVEIQGPRELTQAVGTLLERPEEASEIGSRALQCARRSRGATAGAVKEIRRLHACHFPCVRPILPLLILGWPFARLWQWRASVHRDVERLESDVISVGNITMGGTGKTPFVLFLAERLKRARHHPGILSRGYGRRSPQKHLILEAGAIAAVQHTGDEPQIFLRSSLAPVGIGRDRYRTGRDLEQRFGTDLLILDDGFQRRDLQRQVDIVLIDALRPFGGCRVFPLGRLREPLTALKRADLFLITRAPFGRAVAAIEFQLKRHNPHAPIFRASVVPERWVEYATGAGMELHALNGVPVGAFCGLGNPQSFWHTLSSLGLEPVARFEFSDHHTYTPKQLHRMFDHFRRLGAAAVVTTEKDHVNLCAGCDSLLGPLQLYWLSIRMQVEGEDALLAFIQQRLIRRHVRS